MANYDLTYEGSRVQSILDTGDELRDAGYIFRGEATPSTVPGTPTERVAYIGGPGTYTNFGTSTVVPSGSIGVFKYTGSAWSNEVIACTVPISTSVQNNDTTVPTGKAVKTAVDAEASARQLGDSTLQGGIDTVSAAITAINNAIGNGCVYAGIATPSSTPASGRVFYLALTAGTYTNFNSLEVPQGINILKNNGSTWLLDSFLGIDDAPTQGSANLVKSGGVLNSIIQNGPAFDLSAYNAQEGVLATYADLSAALTALNTLPADFKKGGMSVKFVQTSDNKYVQYRYTGTSTANAAIANVANWHLEDNPVLELYNGGFNGSEGFTPASGLRVRSGLLTGKCTIETNSPFLIFKISLFDKITGAFVSDIIKYNTGDKYGLTYINNDYFYIFIFARNDDAALNNTDNIVKSFVQYSNTDIELVKETGKYIVSNPIYLGRVNTSYEVPATYSKYDVWGISAEPGTYPNLGGVVVPPNTVSTIRRYSGVWSQTPIAQITPANSVPLYNGGFNSSEGFTPTNLRVRTGLLTGHTTLSVYSGYYVYKISVFDKNTCAFIQDINYYDQQERNNIDYTNNDNWYIIIFAKVGQTAFYAHDSIISDIRTDRQTEVELVKSISNKGNALPLCNGGVDTAGAFTTTNLRVRTDLLTGSLTLSVNPPYIVWKIALFDKSTGAWISDVNYYDKTEKNNITYEDYDHYFIVTFANTVNSLPISVKDPIINSLTIDRNTQIELCKDKNANIDPEYLTNDIKTGLTAAVGKQEGNSVIINFITDTHYDEFYGSYNFERFMKAVYSGVPTLNIHGGDILSLMDKESVNAVIGGIVDNLSVAKLEKPVIFVNGNHDSGYNQNIYISASQFKSLYNANIPNAVYPADDVNYFYIDLDVNKLRVYVLDSFNRDAGATHTDNAYGSTQLTWLYNTLSAMQNGWKVIIFTHTLNSGTNAYLLIKAFANKGTTEGGYTFPTTLDVDLVGVIQGHLHSDYFSNSDGFNHIAVTRGWDASNQKWVAFSLFTINLDDGEMFETRIGSGSDRTYTF